METKLHKSISELLDTQDPVFPEVSYTEEELVIADVAKKAGNYLKAPNGEDTRLTPKQWVQVRTSAFKNWFGDWENDPESASKVLDQNGEPMVVYHGSSQWFTLFENGPKHHSDAPDKSIFMSNDRELSNSYISWYGESDGSLPPIAHDVYLNENDPRHKQYSWGVYREGGIYPLFANIKHPLTVDFEGKLWMDAGDGRDINEIVRGAQLFGRYDGVIAKNIKDVGITDLDISELPISNDYVAFNSNQVKSAIYNIGEFSLNDDIRYRMSSTVSDVSEIADRFNVDVNLVTQYKLSMERRATGGAARAIGELRRQLSLSNPGMSFSDLSKRLSPIRKALYDKFGSLEELTEEIKRNTIAASDMMDAARIRAQEEVKAERERLAEFQEMNSNQLDNAYFSAIENGNQTRARDIINEVARRNGYDSSDDFRMSHRAPSYDDSIGGDKSMIDVANNIDSIRESLEEQFQMNSTRAKEESADAISKALQDIEHTGEATVTIYRAVPRDMKEDCVRNGDWITLSENYANNHGKYILNGNYRLMKQVVPASHLYWDGNDINEWGYDDKSDYLYRNTKNNRKLNDLITLDNVGAIIPPSKRFSSRVVDVRYRFIGKKGAANMDKFEEASIRLNNLDIASEMETAKKDSLSIKLATGWERGADNKWRYEQGDNLITYKFAEPVYDLFDQRIVSGELKDFIYDYELFHTYPELSNYKVYFEDFPEASRTMGYVSDKEIHLRATVLSDFTDLEKRHYVNEFKKKFLLHEIQHLIQDIEGFSRGNNPNATILDILTFPDLYDKAVLIDSKTKKLVAEEGVNDDLVSILTNRSKNPEWSDVYEKSRIFWNRTGYMPGKFLEKCSDVDHYALDRYKRSSGEVEARNVTTRMNFSSKTRLGSLASYTEDINRSEQLFFYNSLSAVKDTYGDLVSEIKAFSESLNIPVHIIYDTKDLLKDVNDNLYRFIGEKGARNLDQAEDGKLRLDNLSIAKEMETAGKAALVIKLATGWERGADEKWRYETLDIEYRPNGDANKSRLAISQPWYKEFDFLFDKLFENGELSENEQTRYDELLDKIIELEGQDEQRERIYLDDYVKDDDLFIAYPDFKLTRIDFLNLPEKEFEARYLAGENRIIINLSKISDVQSSLSHEIQHAIQYVEGFSRGGNINEQIGKVAELQYDTVHLYNMMSDSDNWKEYCKLDLDESLERIIELSQTPDVLGIFVEQNKLTHKYGYDHLIKKIISAPYSDFDPIWKEISESEDYKRDKYNRLSGEVEARNVQSRLCMSLEERKNSLARDTEDVARKEQIFQYKSLSASSVSCDNNLNEATSLSESDRLAVHVITDKNDIKGSSDIENSTMRSAKGWFEPSTGKVVIVLPNVESVSDLQATFLHEVVAHKGLSGLLGDKLPYMMNHIYTNLPESERIIIHQDAIDNYKGDTCIATEEYLAEKAEKGVFEPTVWIKVKSAIKDFFRSIGIKLSMSDYELNNLLWKGRESLSKEQPVQEELKMDPRTTTFIQAMQNSDFDTLKNLKDNGFVPADGCQGLVAEKGISANLLVAVEKLFDCDLSGSTKWNLLEMPVPDTLMQPSMEYQNLIM